LHHAVPPVEGSKLGSVNIDGKGDKGDREMRGENFREMSNFSGKN
jgi:hypothetical protein